MASGESNETDYHFSRWHHFFVRPLCPMGKGLMLWKSVLW